MAKAERTDLAEERTNFAEDRTLLANERTFAGWVRTGLSAIGIGLGFHALFGRIEPPWVPRAIATTFLLMGIFVVGAADRRASAVRGRLNRHRITRFSPVNTRLVTIVVCVATMALIGAIWLLPVTTER